MKTVIGFILGTLVGAGAAYAPVLNENIYKWYHNPPSNSSKLAITIYGLLENGQWQLHEKRKKEPFTYGHTIECGTLSIRGLNTTYYHSIHVADENVTTCLTEQERAYIMKKALLIYNELKKAEKLILMKKAEKLILMEKIMEDVPLKGK